MNASDRDKAIELEAQLAGQPLDVSDFALLENVQAAYERIDPVPSGLVDRIQFELTLDALHAEIATLTQLDLTGAGARGVTEEVRTITFTSDSLTTMVTLTPQEHDTVRIDGWATPGAGLKIEVLLIDGPRETYADEDGRFVFESVPKGLAKFALYIPRGAEASTVWSAAEPAPRPRFTPATICVLTSGRQPGSPCATPATRCPAREPAPVARFTPTTTFVCERRQPEATGGAP